MVLGLKSLHTQITNGFKFISNINKTATTITGLGEKFTETQEIVTKVGGSVSGAAMLGKGSADFLEAVACQDGICATISAVGCVADSLQILTSFVAGPNITIMITAPVSTFCKTFVWCCKKSKVPWLGC
jgi:hypothetical protein